ncbi:MAG: undecaprenyl-diphosphate phosphatase [Bacilli bacterium]|nr:undecaprenyl-diphosphate phosphatase [Bacilli bacterium]
MDTIKYIILGMLQGITEPLPISSSGHVIILKNLFSNNFINDLNFEIIINFGSLIAVLFYFRKDLIKILSDFIKFIKTKEVKYHDNYKLGWLLIISTIPAGIVGLLLKDVIENYLNNIKIIGFALIITAFLLYIIKDLKGHKKEKNIAWKDAIIIGLWQAIAIFPGISRSGSTIAGSMLSGLNRETAFKYSFLLYIPISFATIILGIKDLLSSNQLISLIIPYSLSMIAATILTYYALIWFKDIVKKGKLIYFVYYCFVLGTLVVLFL